MRKAFLRRIMNGGASALAIATILSLGASAQWRQNSDRSWSYTYGDAKAKGWKSVSGNWYYFNSNGIMKTGWINDRGNWYYLDNSGTMRTSWICDRGRWYYLNSTGAMQTGWVNDNGKWYYLNYLGQMQTGWIRDNGKWYYMSSNGAMKTGYANISDKIYYFNESGALEQNSNYSGQGNGDNSAATTSSSAVDVSGLPKLPNNHGISVQANAENKILELMNQKRTEAGLKPLIMENTLLQIARYKCNHMIQYNYFDHTNPDGKKWTNWLDAIGYKYMSTGENIAYNTYDPVELFNQWWNSPGHRANMMNSSYNKVGVGVLNGDGKYMGTQTFSN